MGILLVGINAALCAVNAALFAAYGDPISLGVAIFTGFAALTVLAATVIR